MKMKFMYQKPALYICNTKIVRTETKPIWGITFIVSTQVLEKTQEFPENTVFLKEKKIKGKP